LADRPVTDFQHWPPWRPLVVATASELVRFTGQHLIAPQTVLDRSYLAEIFGGLRAAGVDVFHVVLDADVAVLRHRIEGSDEARPVLRPGPEGSTGGRRGGRDPLVQYRPARGWLPEDADLVVDPSAMPPAEVAARIADAVPLSRVVELGAVRLGGHPITFAR